MMKQTITFLFRSAILNRSALALFSILLSGTMASFGQSARLPLPVEQHAIVLDQFQQPLLREGNHLVQILAAGDAIRPPDAITGAPHPSNTVLFTTRIGAGINPSSTGGFIASLIPRPAQPFFVRVYNGPTASASTFYQDSAPYYPNDSLDAGFGPGLTATTNPINPELTPDGMSVSMKTSLGLNPYSADTDGDGYSDVDELAMGTGAADPDDFIPALEVKIEQNGNVSAGWVGDAPRHQHVLSVLGIEPYSKDRLNQVFLDKNFSIQSAQGIHAGWSNVVGGKVGRPGWPPAMSMRDATNRTGIFRLIVQP